MANVTGDEYDELSARVSALESQIASLRARTADVRGEIAQLHDAVQDIRLVQREHTARLDEHFSFHQAHAAGFTMLADTQREHGEMLREHGETLREHGEMLRGHGEMLREILRRLDAA